MGFEGEKADRKITPSQLKTFLSQKGPMDGAAGAVFYAGYVYFEKMRLANKKEKSKKRKEMEEEHTANGVRRVDGRGPFVVCVGQNPYIDQYGKFVMM